MPFANKFIKTMGLPRIGEKLDEFMVTAVEVGHVGTGPGQYRYPIRLVLQGKGGCAGAKAAVRNLFSEVKTTFSGYGNPYQLYVGKYDAKGIGDQCYEITAEGFGARIYLDQEFRRFLRFLEHSQRIHIRPAVLDEYLREYQAETTRKNPKTDWF
ncbi:MAG: hypothetical protein HN368_10865 [Spirochaetales bacterium]|jgi:hypothetical protein|nr:hypothetical protein [Spirochaetales bacterium]